MTKHKGINQTNVQRKLYSRKVSVWHTPFLDMSLFIQSNPLCPWAILQKPINKYPFGIFLAFIVTVARQIFIQWIWNRKCLLSLHIRVSVILLSVYQCCPTQKSSLLINISSRRLQVFSKYSFKLHDQSNQYEYVEYYDKIILLYLVCTLSLVQMLRFCIPLALKPHHTIFRKPD